MLSDLLHCAQDDARLLIDRDGGLEGPRGQAARIALYLFDRDAGVALLRVTVYACLLFPNEQAVVLLARGQANRVFADSDHQRLVAHLVGADAGATARDQATRLALRLGEAERDQRIDDVDRSARDRDAGQRRAAGTFLERAARGLSRVLGSGATAAHRPPPAARSRPAADR
ncbi:hypothetical protein WR25_09694 [Diploscapter pachys]|uniref:Uncharacterized protein n=1 Tax=Diploscapter pachys TaxID=2018661 RepID=A0A2A2M3T7_9BILA|nr:hypothetical protein WR25_09694 [Diploscapter pachys]